MSDRPAAAPLSAGQLNMIARQAGLFRGRTLVDVGTGDAVWLRNLAQRKLPIRGMEERKRTAVAADESMTIGSPAAAVPYAAHSIDTILFRGTSVFEQAAFQPEVMIALANLGSSLKPRGTLWIPVTSGQTQHWQQQLEIFPGTVRVRSLKAGLMDYLTLAFLLQGLQAVDVIEFRAHRKVETRLEWHRLAREAVLKRMQSPAAA